MQYYIASIASPARPKTNFRFFPTGANALKRRPKRGGGNWQYWQIEHRPPIPS